MKKKLRIIKKLLILLESEVNKTSGSPSQDKPSLEKRQPETTWVSSPGHWGAKNAAGNVKYFTDVDTARDYAEGGKGETGVDTQPDDAGAKKQPPVNSDNLRDAGNGWWAAKSPQGIVKYFKTQSMAKYHVAGLPTTGGTLLAPPGATPQKPPATTPPTASTASATDVEKQKKPGTAWSAGEGYWGGKNAQGEVKYFTASLNYTASEAAWDFAEGENTGETGVATLPKQTPPAAATPPTPPLATTDAESHEPETFWDAGDGYWGGKNAKGVVKYFSSTSSSSYHAQERAEGFAKGWIAGASGIDSLPPSTKSTAPSPTSPTQSADADSHEPETFWDAGDGYWGGKNVKGVVKYFADSSSYVTTPKERARDFARGYSIGMSGTDSLPPSTKSTAPTPPAPTPATTDTESNAPETIWDAGNNYWGAKNAKGVVKYFTNLPDGIDDAEQRAQDFASGVSLGISGFDKLPVETPADTTAPTASAPATTTDADSHKPEKAWDAGEGYWGAKNTKGEVKYFTNPLAAGWHALGSDIEGGVDNPPEPGVAKRKPKTTWDTGKGYWGAKNAQEVVKYFADSSSYVYTGKERAQDFADGSYGGKSGIDSLPSSTPASTDADSHAPNTVWDAGDGYWGGKNAKGVVKYFGLEDQAGLFAQGAIKGVYGIDKLPGKTPAATTPPTPAATTPPTPPTPAATTDAWDTGQGGYWGAKNAKGEVKYFEDSAGYKAEELASYFAKGDDWPGQYGVSALPTSTVSVAHSSQAKYVDDISGFVAKTNTLTFDTTSDNLSEYNIGDIPFNYGSINPEFETEYDDTALQLPNGKHIEMFQLLQTENSSIENDPAAKTKEELGGLRYSAGVIIEEDDGRIWILKPTNGFGGYDYTFPKGGLDTDILDNWDDYDEYDRNVELRSAAVREAFEETGLVVQIQGYLGDIQRTTSHNRYFVARRVGGRPTNFDPAETERTLLMHPGEALKSLNSPYDAKLMAMYAEYRKNNPREIKIGSLYDEPINVDFSYIYNNHKLDVSAPTAIAKLGTQKPGTQAGSNPGGLYVGTDGKERYIKIYNNRSQGPGEHLANVIYNALGILAPNSGLIEDNATRRYYSDIIPNVRTLQQVGLNKERARNILRGFVADILTANWDAVGLANDNIVFEPNSDIPIRIDNGGTFLVRAQGAPKTSIPGYTDSSLDDITEYKTFLNPSINPNYARVFAASGYTEEEFDNEVKKQVKHMLKVFSFFGNWSAFTDQVFSNTLGSVSFTDQSRFAQMLNARTLKLAQRFGLVADMDVDVETKPTMHTNTFYEIESDITARYDLKRDMAPSGETGPYPTLARSHSDLVVGTGEVWESVSKWKDDALWRRTIRTRFDILKKVSNFFRHTDASNVESLAPIVQRGMAFSDNAVFQLFMRNFEKGNLIELKPSGFSTTMGPVYQFAELSAQSSTSVIIQVRPASGQKLSGVHIAYVPEYNRSYAKHQGEQEVIVSDRHRYQVMGVYKQPVVINNQMSKLVYVVELEQKPISINEAVTLEDDTDDKIAKYVLDMCMMGNVRTQMPTQQDFRKMHKK